MYNICLVKKCIFSLCLALLRSLKKVPNSCKQYLSRTRLPLGKIIISALSLKQQFILKNLYNWYIYFVTYSYMKLVLYTLSPYNNYNYFQTISQLKLLMHVLVGLFLGVVYQNCGWDASKTINNLGLHMCGLAYIAYTSIMPAVLKCKYFHKNTHFLIIITFSSL